MDPLGMYKKVFKNWQRKNFTKASRKFGKACLVQKSKKNDNGKISRKRLESLGKHA
jgi:hypothetical protein